MENLEIMKGVIFKNNWNLLTDRQIVVLFDQNYDNVTIKPNDKVIERLQILEVGTLELMENRSNSTVYRIKQYDEVYQVFQPKGDFLQFSTEEYYEANEVDSLLQTFIKKEPVFKVESVTGDKVVVIHLKDPRFRALFVNNSCEKVDWIDDKPIDVKTPSGLMKKVGAFYKSYFKN